MGTDRGQWFPRDGGPGEDGWGAEGGPQEPSSWFLSTGTSRLDLAGHRRAHCAGMPSESSEYLAAYETARSCLVGLARRPPPEAVLTFSDLLLSLDDIHFASIVWPIPLLPVGPTYWPGSTPRFRRVVALGGDVEALDLILMTARAV